jgi:hypothetical protein
MRLRISAIENRYKVMLMTGSKRPSALAFHASAGFEQNKTGFQVRRLVPRGVA